MLNYDEANKRAASKRFPRFETVPQLLCGGMKAPRPQITDKARKRKNAYQIMKSIGIFAYCVSFGCKLRSLTSV